MSLSLVLDIETLEQQEDIRLLDARSPLCYEEEHLPNAVNLFVSALMQARADGTRVLGLPGQLERVPSDAGISLGQRALVYGE